MRITLFFLAFLLSSCGIHDNNVTVVMPNTRGRVPIVMENLREPLQNWILHGGVFSDVRQISQGSVGLQARAKKVDSQPNENGWPERGAQTVRVLLKGFKRLRPCEICLIQ